MARPSSDANTRRDKLREQYWPGSSAWLWDPSDTKVKGYWSVSRLMPWVLMLIKELAGRSGDPGPVYLELVCRDFGQGLVEIENEAESAYASGYDTARGLRTWKNHMRTLVQLGFICVKPSGSQEFAKVLLLHPLAVCRKLRDERRVPDEWWTSFVARAEKIGATIPASDFLAVGPATATSATAATGVTASPV